MTRKRALINRLLVMAPWVTVIMLVAMSRTLPNRSEFSPDAQLRKAEVATAIRDVPVSIGRWTGVESPVPPEAQKLLRPNAILSRMYRCSGSPPVNVLVVHCGDARDMIGHYPPFCYPSSGWIFAEADEPADLTLLVNGRELPVHEYVFRRIRDGTSEFVIRIFNVFILPDGSVTRRFDDINQQSERLAVSVQGVAQLQVVTPLVMPLEDARHAAGEILSGMSNMLDALRVGQGGSQGAGQ